MEPIGIRPDHAAEHYRRTWDHSSTVELPAVNRTMGVRFSPIPPVVDANHTQTRRRLERDRNIAPERRIIVLPRATTAQSANGEAGDSRSIIARNQSSGGAMKPTACRDRLLGGAFRGFELYHNAARLSGAERKAQRKAVRLCGAAPVA